MNISPKNGKGRKIARALFATGFIAGALTLGYVAQAQKPTPEKQKAEKKIEKAIVLDTTHAGRNLTTAQKKRLLDTYLAGHPEPVGVVICCCQPGYRTYDTSTEKCTSDGKIRNKGTGVDR
jgi:hypothetical protein